MSKGIDGIVKTYRALAQIPSVLGGRILNNGVVCTLWSQRNVEKGKTTKFVKTILTNSSFDKVTETILSDTSSELLSSVSSSQKLRAVLREYESKQFLEIWTANNLIRSVDLAALDVHGNVYTDVEFASFEFSPDEKYLLYVAELKPPKSEPFYKRKGNSDNGSGDSTKTVKGGEYTYVQDWGEQLVGKKQSIIARYDIESDTVKVFDDLPENTCLAKLKYSPLGDYCIGVAYETSPRKLGLIYCTNRSSTVFKYDFNGNYVLLNLESASVKSPRFTPDGKSIIWIQRKAGGPHATALSLMKCPLPLTTESKPEVIVPSIGKKQIIEEDKTFFGLYNTGFPENCWNGNNLFLSTNQMNEIKSYSINIDDGKIKEISLPESSLLILDVTNTAVLAVKRNFFKQDQIMIADIETLQFKALTDSEAIPSLKNSIYSYNKFVSEEIEWSSIYLGPSGGEKKTVPLIVWPHGGPHGSFANYLMLEASVFLSYGYAILLVNYRGSIGQGAASVENLLGRIGEIDVSDCIAAVDKAFVDCEWLDSENVCLVGGSHGGYLVTLLSGKFPDRFKAVVARNPVIDVASMSITSDIPDWCYAECGAEYSQQGQIDNKILLKMREVSPINFAHMVKAPTLLQIGSKDLRVPPSQGTDYYHRLKAQKVEVKMNLYDDNHPLANVPNEMDNIINTLLWIEKHTGKIESEHISV